MTKYLGSLITADESKALPSQNYETTSANGVWNLNEQLMLNKQSKWPTVNVEDPAVIVIILLPLPLAMVLIYQQIKAW